MSKKPISPLRQRLIDDMTARRFSEDTKKDYVRNVRKFATFLGRSPDTATSEDLRRYQLHMAQQQVSPWSINSAIAALRFFFIVTLGRPDLVRPLRLVTEPRKAPVVLGQEEVVPQVLLRARAIGAMRMRDDKGPDDKLIAVHVDDPEYQGYHSIEELPPHRLRELQRFFLDYKTLENKEVVVEGFLGPSEALRVLGDAIASYVREWQKPGNNVT